MNIVEPIRDLTKIKQMENILRKQSIRDYMLFRLGIYSGLRISDILKLKVSDIKGKDHFILKEQKTGKPKILKIQPELKLELKNYILGLNDDEYLFKSQKGDNLPIGRIQAWKIISNAAKKVGIKDSIGTHSLRKSFGYHMYMKNRNNPRIIPILQDIFNHSSSAITLRYIGISQDEKDSLLDDFSFDYAM